MEQQLEELKLKQRKLALLFGETVLELYKSKDVSFFYTSRGREKEQEVEKLVRLLDYLDGRIAKIEEIYAAEEEESDDEESEEEDIEEEELAEEEEVSQEDVSREDSPVEEESPVEEVVVEEEVLETPEPAVVEEDHAAAEDTMPGSVFGTDTVESAVNQVVDDESSASAPFARERIGRGNTLDSILETASFPSDTNRKLFEKNIKQLSMGSERDREGAINQIAHITPKDVLLQVYEFAMKDESSLVRQAVVKNVSRMKEGESEDFFELGLSDADPKVRTAAIKSLGSHESDRNRRTMERLLKDQDPHVRALAVTYLGIYYGKEGAKKAIAAWTDENAHVRSSLLDMLAIVKPDGAITVVKNLLSDKDDNVKKAAEKALEKLMPERKRGKSYVRRKN
ncbi:MAG: HEAT repeat domain-containing protein [Candidatus Omnitrophica bacterium]|nr:HEAT repeat domain-containing protein [Candidatus Omnitrophota bacterium]